MSALTAFQQAFASASDVPLRAIVPKGGTLHVSLSKRQGPPGSPCFQLGANFKVLPGITILLGHSGAGKTTLLRSIAGLCDPDEGHIAIGERTLFDSARRISLPPAQRHVGVVFQDLALFPHLTVEDNLGYGLRKLDKAERERRITAIAESFQIAHLRKRLPRQISGGEQQRVALARSLVTQPEALLLDEPLSSLDFQTKARIIRDLRHFNETRRIPMLYVTHDHAEASALGERVFALEQGRIVREGTPSEMLSTGAQEKMPDASAFENLFDAVVTRVAEQESLMTCRLLGTAIESPAIELKVPRMPLSLGAEVRIGVRPSEVLLASSRPEIIGTCNVLQGRFKQVAKVGAELEAQVACGVDVRVQLASCDHESLHLHPSDPAWILIQPQSCHVLAARPQGLLQRLFLFVCNANVSRSPIAQAICNAELARRLKVPFEALAAAGIYSLSAGLNASPGQPASVEAKQALEHIGIRDFSHTSQSLTAELAGRADMIFCMTEEQRQRAVAMFPSAAEKIQCIGPDVHAGTSGGHDKYSLQALTAQLQTAIHNRLDALVGAV